jgi:hypothetical protein
MRWALTEILKRLQEVGEQHQNLKPQPWTRNHKPQTPNRSALMEMLKQLEEGLQLHREQQEKLVSFLSVTETS